MRVFHDLSEIKGQIRNGAVTVGSFDGVHAGHRVILDKLRETARQNDGESVVVTFSPHPRQVLHPEDRSLRLLNSPEEKTLLLEQAGIDNLFIVRFTPEFSRLSSEEFARRYLLEGIGAKTIVMGYNHHFGHGREGNRDYLESLKQTYDFQVFQLPKHDVAEQKVSSTVLRFLIASGQLDEANKLLGAPYFLIARRGECGLLDYDEPAKLLPPEGIYPVNVDSGESTVDTNLIVMSDNRLGLPISAQSLCQPGQKLIVRFK
ncbi:FAD synthetase family protein [Alistipes sp. OttesenSCG-928-L06]|nr:FAD synthetase family protein [Alistipes sp. OttesenSCG-928-L06]